MATYRLKSKLYGEFDEKKNKGILGTGITAGQALMVGGAILGGRKLYNNHLVRTGQAPSNLMARYSTGSQNQRNMAAQGLKTQRAARQYETAQQIDNARSQANVDLAKDKITNTVRMERLKNSVAASTAAGATKKDTRTSAMEAFNSYNPEY